MRDRRHAPIVTATQTFGVDRHSPGKGCIAAYTGPGYPCAFLNLLFLAASESMIAIISVGLRDLEFVVIYHGLAQHGHTDQGPTGKDQD